MLRLTSLFWYAVSRGPGVKAVFGTQMAGTQYAKSCFFNADVKFSIKMPILACAQFATAL